MTDGDYIIDDFLLPLREILKMIESEDDTDVQT